MEDVEREKVDEYGEKSENLMCDKLYYNNICDILML